jgi:hypothetical protein
MACVGLDREWDATACIQPLLRGLLHQRPERIAGAASPPSKVELAIPLQVAQLAALFQIAIFVLAGLCRPAIATHPPSLHNLAFV